MIDSPAQKPGERGVGLVVRTMRLVLRALWWRRGLTVAVLAVSVVTTTTAALGPFYARAAAESNLNDHLTAASWRAGLHLSAVIDIAGRGSLPDLVDKAPPSGVVPGYDRRVEGLRSAADVTVSFPAGGGMDAGGRPAALAPMAWRAGQCAHLHIVSGRCPRGRNEALISARTLAANSFTSLYLAPRHLSVGMTLYAGPFLDPSTSDFTGDIGGEAKVRVVGTYRPRDSSDPFWFGQQYFAEHNGSDAPPTPPTIDAMFVSRDTLTSVPDAASLAVDFDYPLTASAVRLDNRDAERLDVARVLRRWNGLEPGFEATSSFSRVVASADRERGLLDTGTLLVTLQLALLAWLVLFHVVADAIEARGNEIAMAKLRGHSPWRTIRFGLGEPLLLLAAAVPLGILAAWGVTHAFAAGVLAPGTPVITTLAPALAALVAFAGGLLAAGLAGYRTLTRAVLDQWRNTARRPGRGLLVLAVDVVAAAVAIAGVVTLLRESQRGGTDNSAALLTPGLLVLAVALIGVRLLPPACRGLARLTRASRRVGTFLASRQVARRPVGLRLATLLAVAVGLATFAVAGESVAVANRQARAGTEVGADRVASIEFASGLDPISATHAADPHGRWAMAAAKWLPDGGESIAGYVLALDGRRLPAVGADVPGGLSTVQLSRDITDAPVPTITTRARAMRIHLTASGLSGDARPQVRVDLRTPRNPYVPAYSTRVRTGRRTYTARLHCAAGCTLRGLTWERPIDATTPMKGTIRLTGIDTRTSSGWSPLNVRLSTPRAWRPAVGEGTADDRVTPGPADVSDEFSNADGGSGGIEYASEPSPIPAVANPRALTVTDYTPKPLQVIDALNNTATVRLVRQVPVLPSVLTNGVVMDANYLLAELPSFTQEATWQVWLGPDAPPDARARLAAAGLYVQHIYSRSERVTRLARQGPALALLLLLACALAGAVLAVGATATSISSGSRRRSYELAALRAVGVKRGALLRAGVLEQLLLLGTAVLLGVPAGFVAARLAMPVIPEFADSTAVTLNYVPRAGPVLLFTAAIVVLLSITAIVAARGLLRLAVAARLREAEG